ncbi:MAG: protein kinase [Pseudonocardiaceae bacterium]|nr:protein kinase [Pseudonocardiaceae bacterium]
MTQRRTVAGRYELTGPLGRGGMGEVWAGYDQRLDRPVAVKLLRPSSSPPGTDLPVLAARFSRESRLTARLEHRGVPAVFDAGTDSGDLYLVMQLIAGHDLAAVIAERSPLPVPWAVAIAAQITTVLGAAHAISLVHRDLKPRNVMLSTDGTVTVLDFGVAALLEPDVTKLTTTGETLGSPAYMAPEQALRGAASPRSDLYALGCLLHEMLCGEPVFLADLPLALLQRHLEEPPRPLRRLRADVPEPVERLVLDLLAKDPEQRPTDAEEVYERLLPHLPGPVAASAAGTEMDPTRPYRRPLAPVRSRPTAAPTAPTTPAEAPDDVRRRAAELVEQGRFTQASELLGEALAREDGPAETGPLHLDLASALLLGGDYRRALALYQQLAGDLSESATADAELVAHCRFQAALCQVEIGELTAALDRFRSLLGDERRRLDELDPELFELRRQIGVLLASTGDVRGALAELEDLQGDLEGVLGRDDPEVHDLGTIIDRLRSLTE